MSPAWAKQLAGHINWFSSTTYSNGVFYFLVCSVVLSLSLKMSPHKRRIEGEGGGGGGGELCSINLSFLEPTLLKVSGEQGGTHWDETWCSVNMWNPFQTQVKPVLLCSVDRASFFNIF